MVALSRSSPAPPYSAASSSSERKVPSSAAAVEELDVAVAVELELPVGVRREPVVVAAVEHDGVVVADALAGQELLEALLVHHVALGRRLQLGGPVHADSTLDVAAVVGG